MKTSFQEAGFLCHKELAGQGTIAIQRFIFTVGLCCHVSTDTLEIPYAYRYCYENLRDCLDDFENWDGQGHPPGNWIKRKGAGQKDLPNPKGIDTCHNVL